MFVTAYANARQLIAWVLGLGEHARILGPPELVAELRERVGLLIERHSGEPDAEPIARREPPTPPSRRGEPSADATPTSGNGHQRRRRDPPRALRPAGHAGQHPDRRRPRRPRGSTPPSCARELKVSEQELREDISVLNVVNFGAGTYVLYAEIVADGHDRGRSRALRRLVRAPGPAAAGRGQGAGRRDRPDRRAHPRGFAGLGPRQGGRRARRGPGPRGPPGRRRRRRRRRDRRRSSRARSPQRRLLSFEYYKENEDEFSHPDGRALRADQRPRGLVRRQLRPRRATSVRHFRLDRIKSATVTDEASSRAPTSIRPPTSTAGRAPARSAPRAAPACGSRPSGPAGRARSAR